MKKAWLAIPAMALCMSFAPVAMADEVFKFEDFFKMADTNKRRHDEQAGIHECCRHALRRDDGQMKKMPGDKGKMMMKGDMMTKEGAKMFIDEWKVYSGA